MAQFYMILTTAGQVAYAQAGAGGSVNIAAVAVGDGGGVVVQPAESWTALVNEVWRGAPTLVQVQPENNRVVVVETHIPSNVGGWYIREVGLISDAGVLLAVGNHPESYKPTTGEGIGKEVQINALIEHGNASQTVLKINPDIVMASRTYVVQTVATHDTSPTAHAGQLAGMTGHIADLGNPHETTAAQVGAEPFGKIAWHNADEAAHPDIRALIAGIVIPVATTEVAGISRRATVAEALAGEAAEPHVTPEGLAAAIAQALEALDGVAYLDRVQAWTKAQYAAPVARTGASGSQDIDLDQHQVLMISATGNITIADPTHMETGKTCLLGLYAPNAQTVSWGSTWHGTSLTTLPTSLTAGKLLLVSALCVTTPDGTYMVPIGVSREA